MFGIVQCGRRVAFPFISNGASCENKLASNSARTHRARRQAKENRARIWRAQKDWQQ